MKSAVLVTGTFPAEINRRHLITCLNNLKHKFPESDIYYTSWDTKLNRHILKGVKADIYWYPEPKVTYNPYDNIIPHASPKRIRRMHRIVQLEKQKGIQRAVKRQFQILSLAHLFEDLPHSYDRYIRVRWDTVLSPKFDAAKWFLTSDEFVCGLGIQNGEFQRDNTLREKRTLTREWLNSGNERRWTSNDIPQVEISPDYNCTKYLYDHMIFFKDEDFDPTIPQLLHKREQLMPAEDGWHQVMCNKRNHTNIHGHVSIVRHVT